MGLLERNIVIKSCFIADNHIIVFDIVLYFQRAGCINSHKTQYVRKLQDKIVLLMNYSIWIRDDSSVSHNPLFHIFEIIVKVTMDLLSFSWNNMMLAYCFTLEFYLHRSFLVFYLWCAAYVEFGMWKLTKKENQYISFYTIGNIIRKKLWILVIFWSDTI